MSVESSKSKEQNSHNNISVNIQKTIKKDFFVSNFANRKDQSKSASSINSLKEKDFMPPYDLHKIISNKNDKEQLNNDRSETEVFDDGSNSYFGRAHTISVLVVGISALLYVVFYETQKEDLEFNAKRGLIAASYFFLAFGITQVKDGPFVRPHPALWRLVLCIAVLYELIMVFLLFQTVSDARKLLLFIDPDLNKPLDFDSYNNECTIYDPGHPNGAFHNVLDKMDIFVLAHLVGWFWKAIIFRDVWITNVISFIFELLEYTFQHQLPNFFECWWDHWILDFIICNGTGIYCGLKFVKYLSIKEYYWQGVWHIHSYKGKMKRVVGQFTPYSWVKFK